MSTTVAPGGSARSRAAPAREQAAAASASRAGRARGSVPRPDNHVIVVFGATGDLAHRKLLPGLFHLAAAELMPGRYQIIGVSPQDTTSEQFRDLARDAIAEFGKVKPTGAAWQAFARRLSFASAARARTLSLAGAIAAAEQQVGGPRAAVPPRDPAGGLRASGDHARRRGPGRGSRVITEKPFGTDLASARALNRAVHATFDESRVFRIDHFLGKEADRRPARGAGQYAGYRDEPGVDPGSQTETMAAVRAEVANWR